MWRLNQLSSTVHTVCTWSLQHCTNPRTSHWGWHTECVMAAFAWWRVYFMKLYWSNNAGNKGGERMCVRDKVWFIMKHLELFKALYLNMITCCPCRWQQQWCTSRFSYDVCGQERAVIMRLDILKQSQQCTQWLQIYTYILYAKVLCECITS